MFASLECMIPAKLPPLWPAFQKYASSECLYSSLVLPLQTKQINPTLSALHVHRDLSNYEPHNRKAKYLAKVLIEISQIISTTYSLHDTGSTLVQLPATMELEPPLTTASADGRKSH